MVVRNNHSKCIILAGVNGAGKSTLFDVYLKEYDLEFINNKVSFIFETTLTSHQSSNSNECSG